MAGETITRIIQSVYGRKYNLGSQELYDLDSRKLATAPRHYLTSDNYYDRWYHPWIAFFKNKWLQLILAGLTLLFTVLSIYYYNLLVVSEQKVLTAEGQVFALMQRRNDISINLSKAVFDYSKHESNVFTGIVALRSLVSKDGTKDQVLKKIQENLGDTHTMAESGQAQVLAQKAAQKALAANPLASLDKLLAVSEQYPDLKLSSTFISLMTALVDVEKDLAGERLKYNDAVNIYTTHIAMFPSNFYAYFFKFTGRSYFEPTNEAKSLEPIAY